MKMSVIVAVGLLAWPVATGSAQGVTDAQIASIVVTANQVDIDAGMLARSRSTNQEVKAFAELMITDHTSVNKSAADLVTRLGVSAQDNPTSQSLKSGGDMNLAHLKTLTGAAFDKAYVAREVAYHEQAIDALDTTLIPGAANEELKALLIGVRPAFVTHLEHAKRLQASTDKAASRSSTRPAPKIHTVTIEGMRFQPAMLTVAPGDTIVWINKDQVPHTATSKVDGFDSKSIQPNKSWNYTVRDTGDFAYICTFHPTMTAMVRVKR